ncbi:hypothetical protein AB0M54_14225 [Actinoplanes sp. NPDC051470]|uniref:hypothetical protein n=1 Tax=Actinoplanes sp. NPDC051470 TaxID=3157224 RepID=UPI00342520DB
MADTENTSAGAPSAPTDPTTSTGPAAPGRRYRPRGETVRGQRLTPRFTDAELSAIKAAADAAQMTVTGFCALAALAVARRRPSEAGRVGEAPAGVEELAELQRELFAARNAVNRTGVNLNQAVAALNSIGAPPVWLEHAVQRVTRAVAEVDTVVARIHRRLS